MAKAGENMSKWNSHSDCPFNSFVVTPALDVQGGAGVILLLFYHPL